MKPKKLQRLNLPLEFSEKINCNKKQVIIRTQEEIDEFNKCIGYRKARMKRYGKSATSRLKEKNNGN